MDFLRDQGESLGIFQELDRIGDAKTDAQDRWL